MVFFCRNEELVAKLNMCKEEYTQKCYEVHSLQKQLAAVKISGEEVPSDSNEAIESVMQELESRREKCKELEEKNAKFEELNISLEERVLIAEQMNEELKEEKITTEEKFESMMKAKAEEISELTQQMLQLSEELTSIHDDNSTKVQRMTNAIQSLRVQLENKDKEIAALKKVPTRPTSHPVPPQSIYTQHPSTHAQMVVPSPVMPPAQNHPPPSSAATNTKECPMCQLKFPGSFSDAEFEGHVQSHFDY